jgi:hypothetical protein
MRAPVSVNLLHCRHGLLPQSPSGGALHRAHGSSGHGQHGTHWWDRRRGEFHHSGLERTPIAVGHDRHSRIDAKRSVRPYLRRPLTPALVHRQELSVAEVARRREHLNYVVRLPTRTQRSRRLNALDDEWSRGSMYSATDREPWTPRRFPRHGSSGHGPHGTHWRDRHREVSSSTREPSERGSQWGRGHHSSIDANRTARRYLRSASHPRMVHLKSF